MTPAGLAVLAAGLALSAASAAADGVASTCDGSNGYAASFGERRTFLWRPDRLERSRGLVDSGSLVPASSRLLEAANRALESAPPSVTHKSRPPASGDVHDYTSLGPYWWPDPTKRDGLPYMRRDGRFNPEREGAEFDLRRLDSMSQDVRALALAYYLSGDQRYAAHAARMVRVWFLDPGTRMNPNLAHAQAIPGRVAGRAEGIIDAHRLSGVVESIGLIEPSGELTAQESQALRAWFGDLVEWMQTSDIGRAESRKNNNHGVYFDLLVSHFALFSGNEPLAARILRRVGARRLRVQVGSNGALPEELKRSRSLHYTAWTLTAAMDLADLGLCVGVDVWNYPRPDRSMLRSAVDFVVPYVGREQTWPWPELDRSQHAGIYELLLRGGLAWDEPAYLALASRYRDAQAAEQVNLLVPALPDP